MFCRFMDYMWLRHQLTNQSILTESDLKLVLTDDVCAELFRLVTKGTSSFSDPMHRVRALNSLHTVQSQAKLVLRMTRGPTPGCIGFHCDGPYAQLTTQISLNAPTEYDGGQLCFFTNNQLTILDRPAGSLSIHKPNVLHAVTNLAAGCRKSLFVLDHANGLGDGDIVNVSIQDVMEFDNSEHCPICLTFMSEATRVTMHQQQGVPHQCCRRCLARMWNEAEGGDITCPICREPIKLF